MVEAESHQPNPEGILPQHQERFDKLQADILNQLEGKGNLIVFTDNPDNPAHGTHISLNSDGLWEIQQGSELTGPLAPPSHLNKAGEKVSLIKVLEVYAVASDRTPLKRIDDKWDIKGLLAESDKIKRSVAENPVPFAESFLGHMENTLEELSREGR